MMADSDLLPLIAYIKQVPPVDNEVPDDNAVKPSRRGSGIACNEKRCGTETGAQPRLAGGDADHANDEHQCRRDRRNPYRVGRGSR